MLFILGIFLISAGLFISTYTTLSITHYQQIPAVPGTPDTYVPSVTYPLPSGFSISNQDGIDQQYENYIILYPQVDKGGPSFTGGTMLQYNFHNLAVTAWLSGKTSYTIPGYTIPGTPGTPSYTIPHTEQVQSIIGIIIITFGAVSIGIALYETQKKPATVQEQ
jgi:hypothetical protein